MNANQLKNGQSVEISRYGKTVVTMEISGNGKTYKIVRQTPTGFTVISSGKR